MGGLLVLPITYYGTFAHQPRMLSLAAVSLALGSFTMSLPHFITDQYDYGHAQDDRCVLNGKSLFQGVRLLCAQYIPPDPSILALH